MKKYLTIGFCICIGLLFQVTKTYAVDEQINVLTTDAILDQSEDTNDIRALSPDIIDFVNSSFEEEKIVVDAGDIDFSKTYCVYVDADIFEDTSITYHQLNKLKQEANKVWVVPIQANGKNIVVQISRALSLHEIQRKNITVEEKEEIENNAGKWQVVSASIQEEYSDYNLQLHEILTSLNIDTKITKCILFGGVPGIQTVLAVLTDGKSIMGIVSLQRDIQAESSGNTRSLPQNTKLEQGKVYSFESYSNMVDELRAGMDEVGATNTSGFSNSNHQYYGIIYIVAIAILSIAILYFLIKRYKKSYR
jgi:hypothetical protein